MAKQAAKTAKQAKRLEGVEWLRQRVCTTDNETKCVKFSVIHDMLREHYHPQQISSVEARKIIDATFPSIKSKRCTESKQTYLIGVELKPRYPTTSSHSEFASVSTCTMETGSTLSTSQYYEKREAELRQQIKYLEARVAQLEKHTHIINEADVMISCGDHSSHGPDNIGQLSHLSIDDMVSEFQKFAPSLYQFFQLVGDTSRNSGSSDTRSTLPVEETKALVSACTLMNARSNRFKGVQLLLSMMSIARSTNKQVLRVLNRCGVCLSYDATWKHLLKLSEEARFPEVVRDGHWVWTYDNLNFQEKIKHERSDVHRPDMNNVTSRLAIRIKHLPEGQIDWHDSKSQQSPSSLTIDDITPNEEDGRIVHERAVTYVMGILVTHFKSLEGLRNLVPQPHCPRPPSKSEIIPMKILAKDEKYQQANLEILEIFKTEANPSSKPQVIIGDQLTCKNIRGVKHWRKPEINPCDTLSWVKEIPGDFHFLWECQKVILSSYWGNPRATGSLSNIRLQIERLSVDQKGSNFATGDEFLLHTFQGHLIAAACDCLGVESTNETIEHEPTKGWLQSIAETIVSKTIMPVQSVDLVHALHRSLLHATFLYADLRQAIKFEDGVHVVRLWKFWLLYFLGSGRKNYAIEAVTMLSNIYAKFPRHIAYICTHNRFVNTTGKEGHGKPVDMMIEHYNLIIKEAMRSSGANVTKKHLEDISMCALFMLDVCKRVDAMFGVPCYGTHTTRDPQGDIRKIATYLREQSVTREMANRSGWSFDDPRISGYKKVAEGKLDAYLHGEEDDTSQTDIENDQQEIDIDYELF